MKVAILLTCHNRREVTLECLAAVSMQCIPRRTSLTVYLVDDGSVDGTAAAVTRHFPLVHVIPGNGSLYWCGGMRTAWRAALATADYDAYLWLNDDVRLYPNAILALTTLCDKSAGAGKPSIIVGSTCDPDDTNVVTYGGWRGDRIIQPSTETQSCDTMCGNIVLVPRE